jgi:uncharacterized membrane protein
MLTLLILLIGAMIGASVAHDGLAGAAFGAVLGWLVLQYRRQAAQIRALQDTVRALAPVHPAAPLQPEQPGHPEPDSSFFTEPEPEFEPTGMPVTAPPPAPEPVPVAEPAPVTPRPAPEPVLPALLQRWLFEGNLIVKAGIAILFIGLAFLARYVGEQIDVPMELRLTSIGAVALALLGVGWRLRTRRASYAQVLQGGAVAALYLTLFAAFRFYGVLAAGPAFALMVGVAMLAAALAVLQDARPLAVIGALGGFATPLLLSTGGGDPVALFGYYLVLDLGIAAVAWHTTWRSLNLIGFLGTFVVASAWGVLSYTPERYASSQAFLIAYFLVFNAILLLPLRHRDWPAETIGRHATARWVNGSLLFELPTITFVLQAGLVRDTAFGVALSALALAAFYVVMAWRLRERAELAVLFEGALAIGTIFLTLVIPFALDARQTGGAWALEGAGLVWLGWRQQRRLARGFGYALLGLAGGAIVLGTLFRPAPTAVVNGFVLNAAMLVAGALLAALSVFRARPTTHERAAEPLLIGWGLLWTLLAIAHQVEHFVPTPLVPAVWLVALSGLALGLVALAVRLDWPTVARPAGAHALVLGGATLGLAGDLAYPLAHGGWWAWPVALATHAVMLHRATRYWPAAVTQGVHVIGVGVVAGLGSLLSRTLTADWGDDASAWAWLGWGVAPALLTAALTRPATATRWPIRLQPESYQGVAAGLLSLGLLVWTLLANAASDGSARPLPALPLLNPLDLGIGAALLAVWLWLRSPAARPLLPHDKRVAPSVLAAAGFVWLNAMLIRAFHHHAGVPFHVDAWVHSLAVQTGLTLLWSITALVLMWLASRRGWRGPWLVGAGLLGLVLLKLVLVDLSGSGTVTRIVSFIGAGVLMLVIGYVAPLPTTRATDPSPDSEDRS